MRAKSLVAHRRLASRRGMSIVVVLGIISITLAMSYAVLRSQGTMVEIQRNRSSQSQARQTAVAGLTIALRKMHQHDWSGVDTTLTGDLSGSESYEVTYTAGDPSLSPTDPDYEDYPFRVTLVSTGFSTLSGSGTATHRIRAIVQLVPRQLAAEPGPWQEMNNYTLYQYASGEFRFNVPMQIRGPIRGRGVLSVGREYEWSYTVRNRYMSDLNLMRNAGLGDYRPFTESITLPVSSQVNGMLILVDSLGVPVMDAPETAVSGWGSHAAPTSYRLYSGGPLYTAADCGSTLENVTLEADVLTNPLGLYYHAGNISVHSNVIVLGTLATNQNINLFGTGVFMRPANLRPPEGSSATVRLPVLIADDDVGVHNQCRATVNGLISVWDAFRLHRGSDLNAFSVQGRIIAKQFQFYERSNWDYPEDWIWSIFYYNFTLSSNVLYPYFPQYLGSTGLNPAPRIQVAPPDAGVYEYHWLTNGSPLYVAHPDDEGLRWDLIEWTDGV